MVRNINSIDTTANKADTKANRSTASNEVVAGNGVSNASESSNSPESVKLSSQAQTLQAAETAIKSLPDVDSAKVADIQARIASGEYSVNPGNIADKLINLDKLI